MNLRSITQNCALTLAAVLLATACTGGGAPNTAVITVPTTVPVSQPISAGEFHTCALKADSTVSCWGSNTSSQLGVDPATTTNSLVPVDVSGLTDTVAVAAGTSHNCAIKSSGQVVCWGDNTNGRLGLNPVVLSTYTPQDVGGLTDARRLSAGDNHNCALRADGSVACWGADGSGQLGDGGNTDSFTPLTVSGLNNVTAVSAGDSFSCALKSDGGVVCWGKNAGGNLGDGSTTARSTPVSVSGLTDASAITTGQFHSCALRTNGTVVCWGANGNGQLGNATTTDSSTPVPVSGLTDAVAVEASGFTSCAVKTDKTVVCWGYDQFGQLGNGAPTTDSNVPVAVTGLTDTAALSKGVKSMHVCSLKTDGSAACWGRNNQFQLGDNIGADTNTPSSVFGGPVFWK